MKNIKTITLNQNLSLYAIYKNDKHIGNIRAINQRHSKVLYLLSAQLPKQTIHKYKSTLVVEGVHFNNNINS